MGKKDTCPTCLEKVDLRLIFADRPWETRNLSWCAMAPGWFQHIVDIMELLANALSRRAT